MKRFLVVLTAAAVAAIGFGGTSAFASKGAATPFKATYFANPPANTTTWTCAGAHVVNKHTLPGSKDSETCIASGNLTGYVAGTFTSGLPCPSDFGLPPGTQCGNISPYGIQAWLSDYNGAVASSWTITETENRDGTFTLEIVAYYPI